MNKYDKFLGKFRNIAVYSSLGSSIPRRVVFLVLFGPEDEGSTLLRDVGKHLQIDNHWHSTGDSNLYQNHYEKLQTRERDKNWV